MLKELDISSQKTFAEFFSGIGLMRIALERQGWRIGFANDIDPKKAKMYRAQFPNADEHLLLADVHDLAPSQVPTVTLATASFPCNDLSLAGSREGLEGKNSSAFWGFVEMLRGMRERAPALLLIENVTGFLSSHGGRDFEKAMLGLNELGYAVDPFVLDAAWFVPQSRQRLFVVGTKEKTSSCKTPQLEIYQSRVRPAALSAFVFTHPEINWRIRPLPDPPNAGGRLDDILDDVPPESTEWWDRKRSEYLLNQMSVRHRGIADQMIARRTWSYGTVFRRVRGGKSMAELRTDGVAGCLRTPRGGSGRQILFKAGYGQYHVRLLNAHECGRLMGVNDFKITVALNQALFGFGDAVCVPAIEWISENYLEPIWEEEHATETQSPSQKTASTFHQTVTA